MMGGLVKWIAVSAVLLIGLAVLAQQADAGWYCGCRPVVRYYSPAPAYYPPAYYPPAYYSPAYYPPSVYVAAPSVRVRVVAPLPPPVPVVVHRPIYVSAPVIPLPPPPPVFWW